MSLEIVIDDIPGGISIDFGQALSTLHLSVADARQFSDLIDQRVVEVESRSLQQAARWLIGPLTIETTLLLKSFQTALTTKSSDLPQIISALQTHVHYPTDLILIGSDDHAADENSIERITDFLIWITCLPTIPPRHLPIYGY